MGFCIGLALQRYIPINFFPRIDFLLLACNQLVNHLDKIPVMSKNDWIPHMIIRTAIGSKSPLNAGPQHTQNHTEAFKRMLTTVHVTEVDDPKTTLMSYQHALNLKGAHLMVEYPC